ncbi:gliding motility protein GldB-related protein [Ekhidna sp.]
MTSLKSTSTLILLLSILTLNNVDGQNKDPNSIQLITSDIDNFWIAWDKASPEFDPDIIKEYYIKKGSKGLKGFMSGRIKNAENLTYYIKKRPKYYASLRELTPKIAEQEKSIKSYLVKMKELYPDAIFPDVYFVIGAMNSGGTTSKHGLIIGADMYGLSPNTPKDELTKWHLSVLKRMDEIPHIVVHELVHFQQKYDGGNLLKASIKEGAADFIAELASGKHINDLAHEFGNAREEELWNEFKERMNEKNYAGWLYSSQKGRPNDLGYWMGYKIVKSYYDNAEDKKRAIEDILTIKDFEAFLKASGYPEKFD